MMKVILCFLIVCTFRLQARFIHSTLEPELSCLTENNLKLEDVRGYIHRLTDEDDYEKVGPYYVCVWKKRKIIEADGSISSKNIVRYFHDIYRRIGLGDKNKEILEKEVKSCENIEAEKESQLAVILKIASLKLIRN